MPNLTDLMLDAHHMNLVHRYLTVRDIIVFYTTSINIIKTSHLPLHNGLLLYEYPFLSYENETWSFSRNMYSNLYHRLGYIVYYNYNVPYPEVNFEHSIFIYSLLKAQSFDDIIAYLGTLPNANDRVKILLYEYAITSCFDTNWEVDCMILSLYNKFTKPYFHVHGFDKLFDLENFEDEDADLSHYMISLKKTAKLLTNKYIKWDYPDLLRFIDYKKVNLIKTFKNCKNTTNAYIHKSDCKSHQTCQILNYKYLFKYF